MWVFDTALIVLIMIPVLASFVDWKVPGVTARHWLLLVLAIPGLFLSRNLFVGIIMHRRHAALTAAYLEDACCWCGHGLAGAIEQVGDSDRCPVCGSPNPASPPALLPSRG